MGWKRATRTALCAAATASMVAGAAPATAQDYPTRPIKLVVPFPAGGAPDILARSLGSQVERALGKPFVIENRPGANGIVGTQAVANAEPDGHTLLHVSSSFAINPSVYKKLPYDVFRDFAPVANVCIADGQLLVANMKVPAKNPAEFIAWAKNNRVLYGSPGVGNPLHLSSELFNVRAGLTMEHVPFRGTAPALTALLSDTIQVMFMPSTAALGSIQDGQLRAIGFTGSKPLKELPDVPLIKDAVPGFVIDGGWYGWFASSRTPPAILDRLNREARAALQTPQLAKVLQQSGCVADTRDLNALKAFHRAEVERFADMVRIARVPPQ